MVLALGPRCPVSATGCNEGAMKDCCEVMTDVAVEQRWVLQIVLWGAALKVVRGNVPAADLMAMFATSALGVIREARHSLQRS
jgi:hypothetical protein